MRGLRRGNFAVVNHEDPEGGFWAEVPALPGCYSQGETIDELTNNIREAIAGVLEVMREQGRSPETIISIPVHGNRDLKSASRLNCS
jgi:predicted RNase H-like HicB family nuclease